MKVTKMELQEILKCIEEEPELPGSLSDEIRNILSLIIIQNDVDLLIECLRITVRLTKEGIATRVISRI